MAQSVACMAGISGVRLEGLAAQGAANARALNGTASTSSSVCVRSGRMNVVALVSQDEVQSRRSLLSLIATTVAAGVFANEAHAVSDIKLNPPPPLSGGLSGTKNADQARDTDLDLKERNYIQILSNPEALGRVKVAAKSISDTKPLIDKAAWPYVQNGLRGPASTLLFDIDQLISSKADKAEKKSLKGLKDQLKGALNELDYACRVKSSPKANKYFNEAVSLLNDIIPKLA